MSDLVLKKNGKIELMRFYFCIAVVLYHAAGDWLTDFQKTGSFSFFGKGRLGVEFFFLLSGFLAAKSAYKLRNNAASVGKSTYRFVLNKMVRILPFHIIVCLVTTVLFAVKSATVKEFISQFLERLPSYFFLQRSGLVGKDLISIEWYIASMLLVLAIIYPLLLKWFDMTVYVIAPVGGSLLLGYMMRAYGTMPSFNRFGNYTFLCNIRALSVILLGCFAFGITQRIAAKKLTKKQRTILVVGECAVWILAMLYVCMDIAGKYDAYFVYLMLLAIILTFSGECRSPLFQNRVVMWLGKVTLPIYLAQNIARTLVADFFADGRARFKILLTLVLAVAIGVAMQLLYEGCFIKLKNSRKKDAAELK